MTRFNVTIRIEGDDETVERLRAAGLENVEVSSRFQIVHGVVDVDREEALSNVEGVVSVRRDGQFKTQ